MAAQRTTYATASKWLHWIMALVVIATVSAAIAMKNFVPEGPEQDKLYARHEALGFLVLMLVIVRLAVKYSLGTPRPAPSLTKFERIASVSAHHLLYLFMLLLPIGGWLALSAYGGKISFFGLFEVPALIGKDEKLSETLFKIHGTGGLILGAIVIAHISGAMTHLFDGKEGVFQRMWFGRG